MGKVGGPQELEDIKGAAKRAAKAIEKSLELAGCHISITPTGSLSGVHPRLRIHIEHHQLGDLGEVVLEAGKKFTKHVQLTTGPERSAVLEAYNKHLAPLLSDLYTISLQKAKIPKAHRRIKVGMNNLLDLFRRNSKEWVEDLDLGGRRTGVGIDVSSAGSRQGVEHHDVEWTLFEKVGLFDRHELYRLELHFDSDTQQWHGSVSAKHPLHEDQFDTLLRKKILPALKTVIDTKVTVVEHLPHHHDRLIV